MRIITLIIAFLLLPAAPNSQQTKPESHFAKVDNIRVHYQNYGSGKEALVFVHGWTCNLSFWKANIPAFINQTRVIAIDLPGHGESDKPQTTYSMDLFARAIDAVLQDAKVERAVLAGHSMGTPVVRQFYRKYPQKTQALILVDGGLRPFAPPEAMEKFIEPFRGPDYKEAANRMLNMMLPTVKDAKVREEIRTAMLSAPQHVMAGAMEGMANPEIWKTQDKINVPVLAIHAKQPFWTDDYERFVRGIIPDLDYQMWEGVSHFLMMDEPQKFNDAVLAFLKKNRLAKG
jgi:pimeloyl-ACP methyl ester carboxylesterase